MAAGNESAIWQPYIRESTASSGRIFETAVEVAKEFSLPIFSSNGTGHILSPVDYDFPPDAYTVFRWERTENEAQLIKLGPLPEWLGELVLYDTPITWSKNDLGILGSAVVVMLNDIITRGRNG